MPEGRLTIGVLGGMGPEATADFFAKLVAATPAARDQDHLRVLIDNDPSVPDRSAAVAGRGPSPAPRLAAMARGLVAAGAELLVMPCNTAHAFADAIVAAAPGTPLLSLIDAAVTSARRSVPGLRSVGLLATRGTLQARLYDDAFEAVGVSVVTPSEGDQRLVDEVIAAVKGGRSGNAERAALQAVALRLTEAGAAAVVTACTELPLVLRNGDLAGPQGPVPVVASTDALVARTVAVALGQEPVVLPG